MITIAEFNRSEDAHLLRLRLEAEGVRAWVIEESALESGAFAAMGFGSGVRVQIAEEDLPAARAILGAPADPFAEAEAGTLEDDEPPPVCPRCSSTNVKTHDAPTWSTLLSILLLDFARPFVRFRWKCRDCGQIWR